MPAAPAPAAGHVGSKRGANQDPSAQPGSLSPHIPSGHRVHHRQHWRPKPSPCTATGHQQNTAIKAKSENNDPSFSCPRGPGEDKRHSVSIWCHTERRAQAPAVLWRRGRGGREAVAGRLLPSHAAATGRGPPSPQRWEDARGDAGEDKAHPVLRSAALLHPAGRTARPTRPRARGAHGCEQTLLQPLAAPRSRRHCRRPALARPLPAPGPRSQSQAREGFALRIKTSKPSLCFAKVDKVQTGPSAARRPGGISRHLCREARRSPRRPSPPPCPVPRAHAATHPVTGTRHFGYTKHGTVPCR